MFFNVALFHVVSGVIVRTFASTVPAQTVLSGFFDEPDSAQSPRLSLDAWIGWQSQVSLQKLLNNIAPNSSNAHDAAPGTVLASPSKVNPDYYHQWVRDSAITLSTLVNLHAQNATSRFSIEILEPILKAYVNLSTKIQHTTNPSDIFHDLSGLGEPKFHADGSPFTGSWGRPQRDGPALRALTMISYMQTFDRSRPLSWVDPTLENPFVHSYGASQPIQSVIEADLEYVSRFWNQSGFDLWEEVQGMHFFTAMVQLRALRMGAAFAGTLNGDVMAKSLQEQAAALEQLLHRFWSYQRGHLMATLNSARSGLDCGILVGAILGSADDDPVASPYPPHSDRILVSLLALVKDQRARFPINADSSLPGDASDHDELAGAGIGRYPEDVYDGYGTSPAGGNPWFLCTSSVSEIIFRTASFLINKGKLRCSSEGLPFLRALLPTMNIAPDRNYHNGSSEYVAALERPSAVGDGFLAVVRKHAAADGSLSEQFDKYTGYERGARDLSWSYGAFLQAVDARQKMKHRLSCRSGLLLPYFRVSS